MEQVIITLTPLNGSFSPAERTITLNPDKTSIQIGRASKSPTKGLVGAADNAWFDSPVMSRDHAIISLNVTSTSITIRDIGSMHGTYLNYSPRLEKAESKELKSGDVLVFGAEVKRGLDTFPACAFQIAYEFKPYKTRSTFNFPESSDIEDDEEYDISGDEFNETLSSVDGVSVDSSIGPKASASVTAIDLTSDEPVEAPLTPAAQASSIIIDATPIIHLDCEEEVKQNDEIDLAEPGDSAGSEASEDSEIGFKMRYEYEETSSSGSEDEENDENCEMEGLSPKSDGGCRLFSPVAEGSDNEESRSDVSLSEAGREGIKALLDEGLLERPSSPDLGRDEDYSDDGLMDDSTKDSEHMKLSSIRMEPQSSVSQPIRYDRINEAYLNARQPSPSDAAMVKPAAATILPSVSGAVKVDHLPMKEWLELNALSGAEKARKTSFFEARHHNKTRFDSGNPEVVKVKPISFPEFPPTVPVLERPKFVAPAIGTWTGTGRVCNPSSIMIPVAQGTPLPYLDDHTQVPFVERQETSPEPDMTSAVKFNESRASIAASNKTTSALSSNRSGLSILDIIEVPKNNKRKAEGISDLVEDEVRMWASSPSQHGTSSLAANVSSSELETSPNTTLTESSSAPKSSESRPIKRFRKMAERLGYAALGGAAVGAGLFSILVATAPDFM